MGVFSESMEVSSSEAGSEAAATSNGSGTMTGLKLGEVTKVGSDATEGVEGPFKSQEGNSILRAWNARAPYSCWAILEVEASNVGTNIFRTSSWSNMFDCWSSVSAALAIWARFKFFFWFLLMDGAIWKS
ncbi:hypothetical protein E6O75_ATG10127 [Venturia nashicola]|uniref:Uncharacterized protein n=1 Tax=Venturia nashicola TaxID=86259 RepID=A0A4Z1NQJ1_9PEZI|nr:hypothetical protein E6O75_ATG10127 [Venturia nashicola]